MIKEFNLGRTYVCIDAANIFYLQRFLSWRIDYERLKRYFEDECSLVSIHFYSGVMLTNKNQQEFLSRLESLEYHVVTKEVKKIEDRDGTFILKANLDVEIAMDTFKNINQFDTFVLLSGDSDFAVLLDRLKAEHKRVVVMSTKGFVSKELLERAKYIDLKKLKESIEI